MGQLSALGVDDKWQLSVLDEIFKALASSRELSEQLIYKGARVLRHRLQEALRASFDIDASLANWNSPRKVDSKLRVFGPFVLRWGNVPQRRVTTLVVVEHLDVLDERCPRLGPRGEVGVVDQLFLQRGEEALPRWRVARGWA